MTIFISPGLLDPRRPHIQRQGMLMIETILHSLLQSLAGGVDPRTVVTVVEELEAGEPAIAFERLCDALFEEEVTLSPAEVDQLIGLIQPTGSDRYKAHELTELGRTREP